MLAPVRPRKRRITPFGVVAVILVVAFFAFGVTVVITNLPGMASALRGAKVQPPVAAASSGPSSALATTVHPSAAAPPSSAPSTDSHWGVVSGWVPHDAAPKQCVGLASSRKLTALDEQQLEQVLETASALNCWVTWELPWRELQPRGSRQKLNSDALGNLKAAVKSIESTQNTDQQPVRLVGQFGEAPSWAHRGVKGCDSKLDCGPDAKHVKAYSRIVRQVSWQMKAILGPNCFQMEGWYQPNSRHRFQPGVQPRLYAQMMRSVYPALKRMGVPFIMGDLAVGSPKHHITPPDKFLRQVYSYAGGRFWDAVGVDAGDGGWLWPLAVHKVRRDRIDVAALDVSPATDSVYMSSLLQDGRRMRWLGFVLVKVPDASGPLVQQIQAAERSGH
jgi:hypothetical protein